MKEQAEKTKAVIDAENNGSGAEETPAAPENKNPK
jgi:hypothetical protein